MKPLKIYISGAVTGTCDYTERFARAEREIAAAGGEPINPLKMHKILKPETTTWEQFMIADLGLLRACDAVYMIPGWKKSKGARMEHDQAQLLGLPIIEKSRGRRMKTKVKKELEDILDEMEDGALLAITKGMGGHDISPEANFEIAKLIIKALEKEEQNDGREAHVYQEGH